MSNQINEKGLVSIVMPAYNCEKYIGDAIKSVINQTYKNWELIVLDDGSKDSTVNIINGLAQQDKRIKFYLNEKNQGVSATRNRGISIAKGEWIAFLDSDDMWQKEKLEMQMSLKEKVNAEFVFTGSSYINEIGESFKGIFEVPEQVDYKKLRRHNVISCSSVLIKKKFFKDIKMEKDDMHEDYAVWLRILKQGVIAYAVNDPLLIYRISRNSKSGNKLKTLKMTYKVFRFIGVNPIGSVYFMSMHVFNSVKKYRVIKKGKGEINEDINDM